jgi:hypothetical protein
VFPLRKAEKLCFRKLVILLPANVPFPTVPDDGVSKLRDITLPYKAKELLPRRHRDPEFAVDIMQEDP